jgi:hypothetical protein
VNNRFQQYPISETPAAARRRKRQRYEAMLAIDGNRELREFKPVMATPTPTQVHYNRPLLPMTEEQLREQMRDKR